MIETVYEHIKGEKTFTVTAADRWSIGMINRLKARFPDEVSIRRTNADGSIVAWIPFEWMRIVPKKKLSEEQIEGIRQRFNGFKSQAGQGDKLQNSDE